MVEVGRQAFQMMIRLFHIHDGFEATSLVIRNLLSVPIITPHLTYLTRLLVQIGFVMHHNSLNSVNLHTHSYLTLSYKFLTTPLKQ